MCCGTCRTRPIRPPSFICSPAMKMGCVASAILALLAGCKREERQSRLDLPIAEVQDHVLVMPNGISGRPPEVIAAQGEPFRNNAYQLSKGKRLFEWFNCQRRSGSDRNVAPAS